MPSSKLEDLTLDVAELNKLLLSAERQRVKDVLRVEIRRLETEINNLKVTATNQNSAEPRPPTNKVKCYEVKLNNYAWDQSDKFVKIFVTLKNVHTLDEPNVYCVFTNRSMELNAKGLDGRNYVLPIRDLLEEIDVTKSYWKVKTDNVVVFMAKVNPNSKWSNMTGAEKKAKEARVPKMSPEGDPSAGLMDMMKQMYDDGDDDMKRTIAKAWTESRDKQMGF